jgi:hypothetical protein
MIVKDVEDGLSNFPECIELCFECDGKPLRLLSIETETSAIPGEPSRVALMRFTDDGAIQG